MEILLNSNIAHVIMVRENMNQNDVSIEIPDISKKAKPVLIRIPLRMFKGNGTGDQVCRSLGEFRSGIWSIIPQGVQSWSM